MNMMRKKNENHLIISKFLFKYIYKKIIFFNIFIDEYLFFCIENNQQK